MIASESHVFFLNRTMHNVSSLIIALHLHFINISLFCPSSCHNRRHYQKQLD